MSSKNKLREAKRARDVCINPKTLDHSSSSAGFSDAISGDSTRPDNSSSGSSSGLRFSKNTCAICLAEMKRGEGEAIFTAECGHSFHFQCITSSVKHGNQLCPLCRFQWKQVPLGGDSASSSDKSRMGQARFSPTIPPQDNALLRVPRWPQESFRFPEGSAFNDDEFLPRADNEIENSRVNATGDTLEVKLYPEVSAVPKSASRRDFAVLINLKAPGVSQRRTRAPVDLIAVLDVSGSMSGIKIALLKRAMGFIIQNLGPTDRLSVIIFSSTARRLFPLRLMSETGKQEASWAVNSLVANGGTNIADGLRIGAKVIADRRWKNPVSGMMLLSDGQDTHTLGHGRLHFRTDYESLLPDSCRIPIHTFGFGLDHDADLLHTISELSGGTFSFIEAENIIQDAFAQCIGGLLSVVVQELRAEIECVHPALRIGSIKAGSYRISTASDGRAGAINVGDLYAEEERDFLVILEIPANGSESMPLLNVKCVYKDPVTKELITSEPREVSIQRPRAITRQQQSAVSIEVDRQRNRFLVAQVMSEARVLAEEGDLNRAVTLLETGRRELSQTASAQAGDRLCKALSAELLALQERMANQNAYESTGRAYVLSSMSSHTSQRATARGDSTETFSPVQAYQTSAMANMVSRSQQLTIENPCPDANANPNPNLSPAEYLRRRLQKTLSFPARQRQR